ncbi:hypothetical protein [Streptomyces nitrosporeus]|uniref:hypothetical protein n=1 Tax=Streptomyces nitrosporeus TaxID=28894 RepID=UPI00167C5DAD|nr:hypothetical protein [Streptomyces nitrosporeus]GGZ28064.1 hypothetical protein GCM10010327_68170 [Streptomyces nitrosporeus]
MPIYAGQVVTAGQLTRLQPRTYKAVATGTLSGAVTAADVPGCSITLTTQAAGAIITAAAVFDFDPASALSGLSSGRLVIDGAGVGEYAVYQSAGASADRQSTPQSYRETIAAAGTHTIKLQATLVSGMALNLYTTLLVTVYEVV